MYNAEIKEQFLDSLPAESAKNARWRFLQIAKAFETPLQKDILEATQQELNTVIRAAEGFQPSF